jgi:DNA-directed RNA polymerase specialized sigma24 family protein
MEVTAELVDDARRGKRRAIVDLLTIYYPVVWRVAVGLTGREDVGKGIVRHLMQRSMRAMPTWKDEGAPTRWFGHHTVLTSRRTLKHKPEPTTDALLGPGPNDPTYVAFVRAIRTLPMQQKEAFILHFGEKLDARAVAVAMDCSVGAVQNHLLAAVEQMRALDAQGFDPNVLRMRSIYQNLGPTEQVTIDDIRQRVRSALLPWTLAHASKIILLLILLGMMIWLGLWTWRIIDHSMTTAPTG